MSATTDRDAPVPSIFCPALRSTSVGILILITIVAFEAMAVAAALPTAARELHGLAAYGWAFTGFLIGDVIGMVVSGQVSDKSGPRLPLVAGLATFTAGLIVSGTATSMAQLVSGRFVQGMGGGLLLTATYVVLGEVYEAEQRPRLFAAMASAWVVPSLVGPLISGTLTQQVSWRWVFLGLLPFVVVGALLMLPALRTLRPSVAGAGRLPDGGRIVRAVAVAVGVAALEEAGQHPAPLTLAGAALGLVALVWGLRTLLPAGTLRVRRGVSAPIAMRGLLAGSFFGVECMLPLTLTVQHGFGATAAALPLAAAGCMWATGSWWQGRHRDPNRARLIRFGFGFIALGAAVSAAVAFPSVPAGLMYLSWGLAGLGAGLGMSSVSVLLLDFTNDDDRGSDSAALQVSDVVGGALCTGFAGVLIAAAARGSFGYTAGFVILDLTMCAVALAGVAVAGQARPVTSRRGR